MVKKKSAIAKNEEVTIPTKEYAQVLSGILNQINEAQVKAAVAANRELALLYWSIGQVITEQQEKNGWGTNFVERLAKDLQNAYPGIAGFSRSNLFRMKAFFVAYSKSRAAARQIENLPIVSIPWFHNVTLLERVKDTEQRLWYAQKVIENGWSRSVLETWIESDLFGRQGKAITNFKEKLPAPQSDVAHQTLKDPYLIDFLLLQEQHTEQEIEQGLIDHIQKFLLELGQGFAFIGRQVPLHIGNKDYYIDLLFYHVKLRCYIVVELKAREFDPRDTGQIGFYLSAVDDVMKHPDDMSTIGLLLCKDKDTLTVEYALRASSMPIGVASYQTKIVESLPKNLKGSLPTVQEIEAELEKRELLAEKKSKRVIKKGNS
jgi:predicted nuclease of restriction endonuclease-like (RecB) superfamily